jgi:hypothetical protein
VVPDDATFVMVLGPKTAFDPAELETLARYVDGGGKLLVAMDPEGDFRLGPSLEGRFGVGLGEVRPGAEARIGMLVDDKNNYRQRGNESDWRMPLTNQFSSHASTTELARGDARNGILLQTAAALFDRPFDSGTVAGEKPKRTYVIRSMPEAWLDYDNDLKLGADEKRDRYNIGAAIEGPKAKKADGSEATASAPWCSPTRIRSAITGSRPTGQITSRQRPLAAGGAVRWLGGEETMAWPRRRTRIKQTKRQQAGWFVATTTAAPLVMPRLARARPPRRRATRTAAPAKKETTPWRYHRPRRVARRDVDLRIPHLTRRSPASVAGEVVMRNRGE